MRPNFTRNEIRAAAPGWNDCPLLSHISTAKTETVEKQREAEERREEIAAAQAAKAEESREAREKIRDWGKVHRGINNGKYGAPVFWTPERNAIVAQLRSEGKTFAEIGDEFGKSRDAVRRQWYNIRDGRASIKKEDQK